MKFSIIEDSNYFYFITSHLGTNKNLFLYDELAKIIIESWDFLRKKDRCFIFAFVIMPTHIHYTIKPRSLYTCSKIVDDFNSFTAHEIIKKLKYFSEDVLHRGSIGEDASYHGSGDALSYGSIGENASDCGSDVVTHCRSKDDSHHRGEVVGSFGENASCCGSEDVSTRASFGENASCYGNFGEDASSHGRGGVSGSSVKVYPLDGMFANNSGGLSGPSIVPIARGGEASSPSREFCQSVLRDFEKSAIRKFDRKYNVWENTVVRECYSDKFLIQKIEYIHNNPMAKNWHLVNERGKYKYSSACFYDSGVSSIIKVDDYRNFL